ncbi:PDZ domain-containing protein MAGIX isoform X1 [Manis pentadactyla]|uniref:PDZ domain-containing protein MAGIX isoform X1 n=1 Tax=Manis pentadactyla TaxID=143292 RepID=UPI00255C8685|nr:PDZ domain-containing protein MAGIX isoform X1 [Manis pentadactyla]
MEPRAGGATDPRGSRGGRGPRQPAGPRARQLLARLDARPLAARAAADVAALVRRAGTTSRLRSEEAVSVVDSAEIEVTDSRLPKATLVEHQPQHRQSETMCTCTASSQVTQGKARYASKPPQASSLFFVELVRGSAGFGLTFSGCRGVAGDATLTVHRLLKDGPAQRCGRLQAGDLVLHINGESTQGLTHAQVVEQIRTGGPRLHLMLSRPLETHPGKPKEVGEPRKRDVLPPSDCSPDPGGPEIMKSRSASAYPLQHLRSRGSPEPHPEGAAEGPVVPSPERLTEGPDNGTLGSPGPWLVPSEERLSRALGVPGTAHLALEMATGRRRH